MKVLPYTFIHLLLLCKDSETRNGDVTFSQFAQLYRNLMFDAQKTVSADILCAPITLPLLRSPAEAHFIPHLCVLKWLQDQYASAETHQTPVVEAIITHR